MKNKIKWRLLLTATFFSCAYYVSESMLRLTRCCLFSYEMKSKLSFVWLRVIRFTEIYIQTEYAVERELESANTGTVHSMSKDKINQNHSGGTVWSEFRTHWMVHVRHIIVTLICYSRSTWNQRAGCMSRRVTVVQLTTDISQKGKHRPASTNSYKQHPWSGENLESARLWNIHDSP